MAPNHVRRTSIQETIPNAGRMMTYTSGCPKYQNRCWNTSGSPRSVGDTNAVLVVLSRSSRVIPAPSTGRVSNNRTDAVSIHHVSKQDSIE